MERLDIAISTYGPDGPARIAAGNPPEIDGVRYVVSWQRHDNAPLPEAIAARHDMTVSRTDTVGLSLNRNCALALCTADLVLIADDDEILSADGITKAIEYMEKCPRTAVFTFIVRRPGSRRYPEGEFIFRGKYPANYFVCSCETALRRSKTGSLRFHPDFGLNSPDMHGGEDELFHLTAMRRGLECRFAPIVIGTHPHAHTGFGKPMSPQTIRSQGCIATLLYPHSFAPRLLLKALRIRKARQGSFFTSLRYLCDGALRAFRLLRTDRERLW